MVGILNLVSVYNLDESDSDKSSSTESSSRSGSVCRENELGKTVITRVVREVSLKADALALERHTLLMTAVLDFQQEVCELRRQLKSTLGVQSGRWYIFFGVVLWSFN
jgi:hypothetical protein